MPSGSVRIVDAPSTPPTLHAAATAEPVVRGDSEHVEIRCPQCWTTLLDGWSATLADMIDVADAHRGRCTEPRHPAP
jgi:hypothetical protein